eukprot:1161913-Pelagomonas_calceolata.AAC.18
MSNSHFDNTCEHTITHRCAEFFMSNGHYDKAVKMTVAAGRHTQALELAVQHEAVDPGKGAVEMSVAGGRNTQALDSVVQHEGCNKDCWLLATTPWALGLAVLYEKRRLLCKPKGCMH